MSPALTPQLWTQGIRGLLRHKWQQPTSVRTFIGAGTPGGGSQGINAKHDMRVVPTHWQWGLLKDRLHFWLIVTAAPMVAFAVWANLKIGPAKLRPIPEGYFPTEEEYYQNPVTRFIRKYVTKSHQQEYETHLHAVFEDQLKYHRYQLIREVKRLMKEEGDYKGYYHAEMTARYLRKHRAMLDEANSEAGKIDYGGPPK